MYQVVVKSAFGELIVVESYDDQDDAIDAKNRLQSDDPYNKYYIQTTE